MIDVKTQATLRIKENGVKRLIPAGATFHAKDISDLPEWLQQHIKYFRKTMTCSTLIIKETAAIPQPIDSKGIGEDTEDAESDKIADSTEDPEKLPTPKAPENRKRLVPPLSGLPKEEPPKKVVRKLKTVHQTPKVNSGLKKKKT